MGEFDFWGLDFGTTTSFLSSNQQGLGKVAELGPNGYIPSVVGLLDDEIVFGDTAEQKIAPHLLLRSIKRLITLNRYQTELHGPDSSITVDVDEAIIGLLRAVRNAALYKAQLETAPIRIGCPAMWEGPQRKRLMRLAEAAGFEIDGGIPIDEPFAACVSWIQNNSHINNRMRNERVLVFDMGGGTLDLALIQVNAEQGRSTDLKVLGSVGNGFAGDHFDDLLTDFLIKREEDPDTKSKMEANPEFVKILARKLKIGIANRSEHSDYLVLPGDFQKFVTITADEMAEVVSTHFEKTQVLFRHLVQQINLMGTSRRGKQDWYEVVRDLPANDLLGDVDRVVLAGGMTRLVAMHRALEDFGFNPSRMESAHISNPDVAVSEGLGSEYSYQSMNIYRPSFDFVLSWTDEETGKESELMLIPAYSAFTAGVDRQDKYWNWSKFKHLLPMTGTGKIRAMTLNGQRASFRHASGRSEDYIPFSFGDDRSDAIFKLSSSGRIFIRHPDARTRDTVLRVEEWPVNKVELEVESYTPDYRFRYGISP